jgi:hypothetical protein
VFRHFCYTPPFRWPASGSVFASFPKPRECHCSGLKAICAQDVHCDNWEKLCRSRRWLKASKCEKTNPDHSSLRSAFGLLASGQNFLPPEAVIHPGFDQPFCTWKGERVKVVLTPSLLGEPLKYLHNYDQVMPANSIHQRGLRHEYKIAGKGTPLIVYAKNPEISPQEKHYPSFGITLGLTAVKEERPGQVPLLKLYDAFDPSVVRSSYGSHPIAANFTATLAVLNSHARKVAGSAAGSFIRPDNPRFATGIYLIQPYDPNKIPILFVHGLISSPISWQNLTNDLCSDPKILEYYQPWFFLYPTGEPVLESAEQLREALQATQKLFDPEGTAVGSHHVVVIAHSMGGLLAHTLVSDSSDSLWNAFATKPFTSLTLSADEKHLISGYFLNRYFARVRVRGGPTSLFSLAPNPLLDRLASLPIRVPYHSIIGDRGLDGGTRSSDGVVAYSSSHLAGAESEKIVPAGHTLFSNEAAVLEIKRILEENIARDISKSGRLGLVRSN